MTIRYSAPDCGVGMGAGTWEPGQALISFHCQSDRLLGLSLSVSTGLAHSTCPGPSLGLCPKRFSLIISSHKWGG